MDISILKKSVIHLFTFAILIILLTNFARGAENIPQKSTDATVINVTDSSSDVLSSQDSIENSSIEEEDDESEDDSDFI